MDGSSSDRQPSSDRAMAQVGTTASTTKSVASGSQQQQQQQQQQRSQNSQSQDNPQGVLGDNFLGNAATSQTVNDLIWQNITSLNPTTASTFSMPVANGGPLWSTWSSLLSSADNIGNVSAQTALQSQPQQQQVPAGALSQALLLPRLLQQQSQENLGFASTMAAAAPTPQTLLGLGDQQLLSWLLQQQQQKQATTTGGIASNAARPNPGTVSSDNVARILAQALGAGSNSSSNNASFDRAPTSGLDFGALLSALSSNMTGKQPTALAPSSTVQANSSSLNKQPHTNGNRSQDLREAAINNGVKLLPCRARGQAMDHNIHTAYFEVPEDAAHGGELVCSYPACRNSGVRFLYCAYCDAAISRRGFKVKHVHDNLRQSDDPIAVKKGKTSATSGMAAIKKRKIESLEQESRIYNNSSQDSSLSNGVDEERGTSRKTTGQKIGAKKTRRGESLRIQELQRDWSQLLEESRKHRNAPDAESKRKAWLQKVESIYDEYSMSCTLDSSM